MQVTDELMDKLARLSMLDIAADERESLRGDLERMIGFVARLQELDTSGVAPLMHMSRAVNVLREDEPGGMLNPEEALANAPHTDGRYFLVPKMIKKTE